MLGFNLAWLAALQKLRFALGEFHYGQRATKFLPGQRKRSKQVAAHSTTDVTAGNIDRIFRT